MLFNSMISEIIIQRKLFSTSNYIPSIQIEEESPQGRHNLKLTVKQ